MWECYVPQHHFIFKFIFTLFLHCFHFCLQWTVKEFDAQLTRDICDLIDREADLLNRGRPIRYAILTTLTMLMLVFTKG